MICSQTKGETNKSIASVDIDIIYNVTEAKPCTNRNISHHGVPEIDATAFFNTQGVDYNKALRVKCENQEFYI